MEMKTFGIRGLEQNFAAKFGGLINEHGLEFAISFHLVHEEGKEDTIIGVALSSECFRKKDGKRNGSAVAHFAFYMLNATEGFQVKWLVRTTDSKDPFVDTHDEIIQGEATGKTIIGSQLELLASRVRIAVNLVLLRELHKPKNGEPLSVAHLAPVFDSAETA